MALTHAYDDALRGLSQRDRVLAAAVLVPLARGGGGGGGGARALLRALSADAAPAVRTAMARMRAVDPCARVGGRADADARNDARLARAGQLWGPVADGVLQRALEAERRGVAAVLQSAGYDQLCAMVDLVAPIVARMRAHLGNYLHSVAGPLEQLDAGPSAEAGRRVTHRTALFCPGPYNAVYDDSAAERLRRIACLLVQRAHPRVRDVAGAVAKYGGCCEYDAAALGAALWLQGDVAAVVEHDLLRGPVTMRRAEECLGALVTYQMSAGQMADAVAFEWVHDAAASATQWEDALARAPGGWFTRADAERLCDMTPDEILASRCSHAGAARWDIMEQAETYRSFSEPITFPGAQLAYLHGEVLREMVRAQYGARDAHSLHVEQVAAYRRKIDEEFAALISDVDAIFARLVPGNPVPAVREVARRLRGSGIESGFAGIVFDVETQDRRCAELRRAGRPYAEHAAAVDALVAQCRAYVRARARPGDTEYARLEAAATRATRVARDAARSRLLELVSVARAAELPAHVRSGELGALCRAFDVRFPVGFGLREYADAADARGEREQRHALIRQVVACAVNPVGAVTERDVRAAVARVSGVLFEKERGQLAEVARAVAEDCASVLRHRETLARLLARFHLRLPDDCSLERCMAAARDRLASRGAEQKLRVNVILAAIGRRADPQNSIGQHAPQRALGLFRAEVRRAARAAAEQRLAEFAGSAQRPTAAQMDDVARACAELGVVFPSGLGLRECAAAAAADDGSRDAEIAPRLHVIRVVIARATGAAVDIDLADAVDRAREILGLRVASDDAVAAIERRARAFATFRNVSDTADALHAELTQYGAGDRLVAEIDRMRKLAVRAHAAARGSFRQRLALAYLETLVVRMRLELCAQSERVALWDELGAREREFRAVEAAAPFEGPEEYRPLHECLERHDAIMFAAGNSAAVAAVAAGGPPRPVASSATCYLCSASTWVARQHCAGTHPDAGICVSCYAGMLRAQGWDPSELTCPMCRRALQMPDGALALDTSVFREYVAALDAGCAAAREAPAGAADAAACIDIVVQGIAALNTATISARDARNYWIMDDARIVELQGAVDAVRGDMASLRAGDAAEPAVVQRVHAVRDALARARALVNAIAHRHVARADTADSSARRRRT